MLKKFKILLLNLILWQFTGLEKISAQTVLVTVSEIRNANLTKARLDSAKAVGNLVLIDLKAYQDTSKTYKDSTNYWKRKALNLKRKRNNWRTIALIEALYIGLTTRKKN